MTTPFISICIPTYRRTTFIRQAIESCLRQTEQNFEILVHDASEDDSVKSIIESFSSKKIFYFHHQPPLSLIERLNDFLKIARAKWMVVLCDDDTLEPDFLKILSEHIQTHPQATLFRSRYRLINGEGQEIRLDRLNAFRMTSFEFLRDIFLPEDQNFKMNISGIIFPKSLLKTLGGFKDLYRGWHVDRLAWAELGAQGESICEPRPLCNIRLHPGSLTATVEPHYRRALDADIHVEEIVKQIFRQMEAKAATAEDHKNLRLAHQNFKAYMNRHLSKSFDQGFRAALQAKGRDVTLELGLIYKKMKELQVPLFPSAVLYSFLAPLPYSFRITILTHLHHYKTKKIT